MLGKPKYNCGENVKFNISDEIKMKKDIVVYPNIDLVKTGVHLKSLASKHGYSVKDMQEILQLACPQPIYRWFKGQVLPSIDHLYVLSQLFHMHMEELLVPAKICNLRIYDINTQKRLHMYWNKLQRKTA